MRKLGILTAAIAITVSTLPASAALTDKEVESIVRAEKTWTNRSNLSVSIDKTDVTIGTYREAKSTDKDLKIDSIMITRNIIEKDPDVARVRFRFYDPVNRHNYELVDVRQSDVKAFSQGLVNIDTLLSGINIQRVAETADVAEGPFETERIEAKKQIEQMRNEGVGVAAFMQLFSQAEEYAKARNTNELRTTLDRLNKAFDDHAAFIKRQKDKAAAQQAAVLNEARAKHAAELAAAAQAAKKQPTAAAWDPPPADIDPKTGVERFGMLPPAPGPFLLDRIFVARKINQLRKENYSTANIMPVWVRMELDVHAKNEVAIKNELEFLQKQLGLPALTDEQRSSLTVIKTQKF